MECGIVSGPFADEHEIFQNSTNSKQMTVSKYECNVQNKTDGTNNKSMVKNEKVTNVSYTELGPHIKW